MSPRRFSSRVLAQLDEAKYLKIRSGAEHRFWYRAFLAEPRGAIVVGEGEIPIRAKRATTERIVTAVEAAYAEKYTTPASRRYVVGFKTARRRATTTELVPR